MQAGFRELSGIQFCVCVRDEELREIFETSRFQSAQPRRTGATRGSTPTRGAVDRAHQAHSWDRMAAFPSTNGTTSYQFADTERPGALLFAEGSQIRGMGMALPRKPRSHVARAATGSGCLAQKDRSGLLNNNCPRERWDVDKFDASVHGPNSQIKRDTDVPRLVKTDTTPGGHPQVRDW